MRFLIGTIIYILILSISSFALPMVMMIRKEESIDSRVFRRVYFNKVSFLFDFRNMCHVKKEGIIMPFFIMFLMAYMTILSFVVMIIVYFTVYFESIAKMDFSLLSWAIISGLVDYFLDAIILLATILTSKFRMKEIDNLKPKNKKKK